MNMNIEEIVRKQVVAELEELAIKEIVKDELCKMFQKEFREELMAEVKNKIGTVASKIIDEEINNVLSGETVISDGWGKTKTHPCFGDFVKSVMKEEMTKKYEIGKKIKRLTDERIDALVKKDYNAIVEKIVDELTASKLVKRNTNNPVAR